MTNSEARIQTARAVGMLEGERRARVRRGWEMARRMAKKREDEPKGAFPHYHIPTDIFWQGVQNGGGLDAMRPSSDYFKDMVRRHPELGDPHDKQGSRLKPTHYFRNGKWYREDGTEEPKKPGLPWWCEEPRNTGNTGKEKTNSPCSPCSSVETVERKAQ